MRQQSMNEMSFPINFAGDCNNSQEAAIRLPFLFCILHFSTIVKKQADNMVFYRKRVR